MLSRETPTPPTDMLEREMWKLGQRSTAGASWSTRQQGDDVLLLDNNELIGAVCHYWTDERSYYQPYSVGLSWTEGGFQTFNDAWRHLLDFLDIQGDVLLPSGMEEPMTDPINHALSLTMMATPSETSIREAVTINGRSAGLALPQLVEKWWGYELVYKNDDEYCMKWLHFNKDGRTSMHFHVHKHETLLVVNGELIVETVFDKQTTSRKLSRGEAMVVCPGFVHRLIAADGPVDLIEASTYDRADDSVRVE